MPDPAGDDGAAPWWPSEDVVRRRSAAAAEPDWLLAMRLDAWGRRLAAPAPWWAAEFGDVGLGSVERAGATGGTGSSRTGDADEGLNADLEAKGVVVCPLEAAILDHPELVRRFLGTVVPPGEDTLVATTMASWSGGTFVYVPPGVEIDRPVQAASRGRAARLNRFERTLLVAGEGARIHYIDGCSAPVYTADPVRSSVVEVIVGAGAEVIYTGIQNWSSNVANLAVKRALVGAEGRMEWIDGTIGSRLTATSPTVVMAGPKASGHLRSVSSAGAGQRLDTGARMIHLGPETTSSVVARSIVRDGGLTRHRGVVQIGPDAVGAVSHNRFDALALDDHSTATTALVRRGGGEWAEITEANASTGFDADLRFYLMSRGLSSEQAEALVLNGFIEPVTRAVPLEYAVEWSRLVELQAQHSVG